MLLQANAVVEKARRAGMRVPEASEFGAEAGVSLIFAAHLIGHRIISVQCHHSQAMARLKCARRGGKGARNGEQRAL